MRAFVQLVCLGFACGNSVCAEADGLTPAHDARPNVLFIAVDDLNDWVGFLGGHPQARTPHLDRLATQGMVFRDAHCQAPLCGASRASVYTGLSPATSGLYLQVDDLNIKRSNQAAADSVFLTDWFEAHGYVTMGAGKFLNHGDEADLHDVYAGLRSFGPYPEQRFRYDPAAMGKPAGTSTDWGAFPERDAAMPDHQIADWIIAQLEAEHAKPFFLAAGLNRPHVPWYVPRRWFEAFPLEEIVLPPYLPDDLADTPEMSRRVHWMPPTPSTEWAIGKDYWKEIVQAYLACTAFVDHQVGRMLDALEASPYAENTVIVLWSDHGYHLGEKNRFCKMSLWERSTKVPLVFAGPGVPPGLTSDAPVGLLDIYPTLLALAQLPANPNVDGRNLVPLMQPSAPSWDHPAITFWGPDNLAIRSRDWAYLRYEDGTEELYDRQQDSHEWHNRADDPTLAEIKAALAEHIPASRAPLTDVNWFDWNAYWREKTLPPNSVPALP